MNQDVAGRVRIAGIDDLVLHWDGTWSATGSATILVPSLNMLAALQDRGPSQGFWWIGLLNQAATLTGGRAEYIEPETDSGVIY